MTRVRLPPDPKIASVTTIIDSQSGDAALIAQVAALSVRSTSDSSLHGLQPPPVDTSADSTAGSWHARGTDFSTTAAATAVSVEHVDSVILVYDLDRVETFFRLERHWLPLIERCYNGKVRTQLSCVVANAGDMLNSTHYIEVCITIAHEPDPSHCGGKQRGSLSPVHFCGNYCRAGLGAEATTNCFTHATVSICSTMHQVQCQELVARGRFLSQGPTGRALSFYAPL
jgi:hypothetical protein